MSAEKNNHAGVSLPVIFFVWLIVIGCSLLLSLFYFQFQQKHTAEDLLQQAQIFAESLHGSEVELMKSHHMKLKELRSTDLENKLSLYQEYLQFLYPTATLEFFYMCEGTHLEILDFSGKAQKATDAQKKQWEKAILQKSYPPLWIDGTLSVLHPLYVRDTDCEHMVVCIYFPDASQVDTNQIKAIWHALIYATGYTGIFFLWILRVWFLKRNPRHSTQKIAGSCALGIFLVGLLFSFQLSEFAKLTEESARKRAFENFSSSMTSRLKERLERIEKQSLQQLVAFIEASDEVTREEFIRFTQDYISSNKGSVWFWIPATADGESPAIKYHSRSGDAEPSGQCSFEREKDLIEKILLQSQQKNSYFASDIHTSDSHKDPRIFIAHPTWDEENLRGWVACSTSLNSILEEGLKFGNFHPDSIELRLSDIKIAGQQPPALIQQHAFTRPAFVFERLYLLHAVPTPLYWTLYPSKLNMWIWAFGGAITLILSIWIYQNLQHNYLLETKVKERTLSLKLLMTKYLNIIDNIPLGLALWEDGDLCEMNPKMQTWFITHEDLLQQIAPLIKDEILKGENFKKQLSLQTQFGKRQMNCNALKLPTHSGKEHFLILLEDRTEPLRFEQALTEKKIELERLFNSSTDLLCTTTLDGTLLNLNPQWEETLGHPISEMTGQKWMHFVHKADREQAENRVKRICDGEQNQNFTLRFEHRSGKEIWLEWKATREGNLIHANVRDITARINAEEKNRSMREHVARAQKMESIGRLAGGIAHDFNNSLQVIIGNAQLVLSRPGLPENQKNQLQDILKAADRSARLTHQLLGFAMKQHVHADPTNLNEKFREMEPMFTTILGDQIKILWDLSPQLAKVKLDSGQLEQICVSLLENSRDAMPRGGELTIITEPRDYTRAIPDDFVIDVPPGHYICFSIRDTGSGIENSMRGTLFEPFSTTQDPSKGSGLGLATVYGILQQNKGSVRVKSQPGQGTLMEILLPQLDETHVPPTHLDSPKTELKKIMVVDDNAQILDLAAMMLKELKYPVMSNSSPADALKIIEEDPDISLLITDMLMPIMTGQELYEKALRIRPDLKCIFMSGYSSDVVDMDLLKPEKCTFLLKPFSLRVLKEAITGLL